MSMLILAANDTEWGSGDICSLVRLFIANRRCFDLKNRHKLHKQHKHSWHRRRGITWHRALFTDVAKRWEEKESKITNLYLKGQSASFVHHSTIDVIRNILHGKNERVARQINCPNVHSRGKPINNIVILRRYSVLVQPMSNHST
jgi:hypothetical protein